MSTETIKSEMTWMPEARQITAQCWCDPETSGIQMDARLAEACARRIASWMEEAARQTLNVEYYKSLLSECGATIGKEAYTQDDGGVVPDVLAAKVPELVKKLAAELSRVTEERDAAKAIADDMENKVIGGAYAAVLLRRHCGLDDTKEDLMEVAELVASLRDEIERWKNNAGTAVTVEIERLQSQRDAALRRVEEVEKALDYFRSAFLKRRPNWLPSRVRVLKEVRADYPMGDAYVPVSTGETECRSNRLGAVSVVNSNGIEIGLRPDEFEVLEWTPARLDAAENGEK